MTEKVTDLSHATPPNPMRIDDTGFAKTREQHLSLGGVGQTAGAVALHADALEVPAPKRRASHSKRLARAYPVQAK